MPHRRIGRRTKTTRVRAKVKARPSRSSRSIRTRRPSIGLPRATKVKKVVTRVKGRSGTRSIKRRTGVKRIILTSSPRRSRSRRK